MKISVLTCTGDRPISLNLLSRWMKHQTKQPDQWLIIDDGKEPFIPTLDCDYVYRVPQDNDPLHTLNANIQYAFPYIKGDVILFCEDDEYYAPTYIETMINKLSSHEMVGICKSKYYHLPSRTYHIHINTDHASLAQTGITFSFLKEHQSLIAGDPFIDIRLWQEATKIQSGKKKPFLPKGTSMGKAFLFDDGLQNCLYVGMKGLPGRRGIGSGHKGVGRIDPHLKILKQWISKDEDFQAYANLKIDSQQMKQKSVLLNSNSTYRSKINDGSRI